MPPLTYERRKVFISYSHNDSDWLRRLSRHLRPLERDLQIDIWDDTRINPGAPWREEIAEAVASAKVVVLLISADFLASDFIAMDELPPLLHAAQDEGAIILPLILSPCRFSRTTNLSSFQAVNDPAKPLIGTSKVQQEAILDKVAQSIEATLNSPAQAHSQNLSTRRSNNKVSALTDVEAKEERDKVRRIIDQFDRKAISDFMHEENIAFMCISLNELRVQIQREGIASISDERIRELLITIKAEIDEIITLSLLLQEVRPRENWENSILDLRSMGMQLEDVELEPYYMGRGKERAKERFSLIYRFCFDRTRHHFKYARDIDHNSLRSMEYPQALKEAKDRGIDVGQVQEVIANEMGSPKSLDCEALSQDMAALYVFGCIDELKEQISQHIQKARNYLRS